MRSVQYGCFLQSLQVVFSRCVGQVLSEWIWDGSSRPNYYRHHMHCISIVRFLYFKIFSVSLFITFLSPETAVPIKTCYFLIITFYDARFIVRNNCWILLYEDCSRRNKNLSAAWVGYLKAFNSVPHSWVEKSIALVGVNSKIVTFCKIITIIIIIIIFRGKHETFPALKIFTQSPLVFK